MTWFAAKEHCEGIGGNLVEIDSEEENEVLVEEIIRRREYGILVKNFWIGLTDFENEGDWRLASNGLNPSFLNWHEDQPDNEDGNEHCARIRILPLSFWEDTWYDIDCNSDTRFPGTPVHAICEFDPSKENPSTESSSTANTTEDTTAESTTTEGTLTKS